LKGGGGGTKFFCLPTIYANCSVFGISRPKDVLALTWYEYTAMFEGHRRRHERDAPNSPITDQEIEEHRRISEMVKTRGVKDGGS